MRRSAAVACEHPHVGTQLQATACGKPARSVAKVAIAGKLQLQVCGIHARFWKARGYEVK